MNQQLIKEIKSRGYWRINFQPVGPPQQLTLAQCRELVEKNQVKLRGWPYPFVTMNPADNRGVANHNDYCQGWIDSGEYKEFWRIYKSGQFLHYSAVHEDRMEGEANANWQRIKLESGKYLNFVGSLTYFITEIVEFLTRLHRSGLYKEGAFVSISLHNTAGRQLVSFDHRHLSFPKVTEENDIKFEQTLGSEELQGDAKELALKPILHFYEVFNWEDVAVDQVVKKDQETLYGYKNS